MTHLTVVSGPSGVGKSTVVAQALALEPSIWLSVSATTRAPRPGELDGREYFFVSDQEFDRMVEHGEFLEWAKYASHRYGTPKAPVQSRLEAGTPVLLEIELAGARQVRDSGIAAVLVFLAPPSWEELVARLTGRGTEPPEVVTQRLEVARTELAAEGEFDVSVVNTAVEEAAAQLVRLALN